MVNAVCSLLNVYSRGRQHLKVENIKGQTPKPFKLVGSNAIDDTFSAHSERSSHYHRRTQSFDPLITLELIILTVSDYTYGVSAVLAVLVLNDVANALVRQ